MPHPLSSQTISALRFPLAVMVVFIHSFMLDDVAFTPDWHALSGMDFAIGLQVLLSKVVSHVAVPTFYVISGYLFFLHVERFTPDVYVGKLRKRARSILVPYLLWNVAAILWILMLKFGGVVVKGKPISGVVDWLKEHASLSTFWDCNVWELDRVNWIGQITPPTGPILVPMWFLRDLMVVVALTPVIYLLLRRFRRLALAALAACYVTGIWPYAHGFSITAVFFFSMGAYLSIHGKDLVEGMSKWCMPAYALYAPMTIALLCLNSRETWWGDHIYPFYIIVSVIVMFNLVAMLTAKGKGRWLAGMQGYTFFIYGGHAVFGLFVADALTRFIPGYETHWLGISVNYLLRPTIAILVCVYVQKFMRRWCPRLLAPLVGGR